MFSYVSHVFPNTLEVNRIKKKINPYVEIMVQLGSPNRTKKWWNLGLPPGIHFSKKITTHPDRAHPKRIPLPNYEMESLY